MDAIIAFDEVAYLACNTPAPFGDESSNWFWVTDDQEPDGGFWIDTSLPGWSVTPVEKRAKK